MYKRGVQKEMPVPDEKRVEVSTNAAGEKSCSIFYDKLNIHSAGTRLRLLDIVRVSSPTDLVRLDILLNGKPVDALSLLVFPRGARRARVRTICKKSARHPPATIQVPIQGPTGGQIIARENHIPPSGRRPGQVLRRRITRKSELLE
jgi:GTP-binding protein LepA